MTTRYALAIGSLLIVALLAIVAAGCSSSQQTTTTATPSTNASKGVSADPEVNAILVRSCYGCHSTGGPAPWYAVVSPTYIAANSARKVLNFSEWQTYDAQTRTGELKSIVQSVSRGSMPPGDYTALDHSARLTDDQKQALLNWASQAAIAVH